MKFITRQHAISTTAKKKTTGWGGESYYFLKGFDKMFKKNIIGYRRKQTPKKTAKQMIIGVSIAMPPYQGGEYHEKSNLCQSLNIVQSM